MREERYILMIVSIVGLIAIISMLMISGVSRDTLGDDDTVGFAAHPIYPAFSSPISNFRIDKSSLTFVSSSDIQTITLNVGDSAIYGSAYYSINGAAWKTLTLSGSSRSGSWIFNNATATMSIPRSEAASGNSTNNYLIVYSCTRNSTGWDCHDNRWQLYIFSTINNYDSTGGSRLYNYSFVQNGGVVFAMNLGGVAYTSPVDGTNYSAYNPAYVTTPANIITTASSIGRTTEDPLYQSAIEGNAGSPLSLAIPVEASGEYSVFLGIAEIGSVSNRLMQVSIEGSSYDNNQNCYAWDWNVVSDAGYNLAANMSKCKVNVTDGILNIDMTNDAVGGTHGAFISVVKVSTTISAVHECLNSSHCDDGNPYNYDICSGWPKTCSYHECINSSQCSDGNSSTIDICSGWPMTCRHLNCQSDGDCNDGNSSTYDTCTNNMCAYNLCRTSADCNDGIAYTIDTCSGTPLRCSNTNTNVCSSNSDGYCPSGCTYLTDSDCARCSVAADCSDGYSCTVDSCSNGECLHTPTCTSDGTCCPGCTIAQDSDCQGIAYYVALTGNDGNSGTISSPFRTLEHARDVLRNTRPTQPVTIYIRGGIYELSSSFSLTSADYGSATAPIVYKAYPGESVRISGGKTISSSWFAAVDSSNAHWSRLDPSTRNSIVHTNLLSHGFTTGQFYTIGSGTVMSFTSGIQLSFNGQVMEQARYPNVGEDSASMTPGSPKRGYVQANGNVNGSVGFQLPDNRYMNWQTPLSDVILIGNFYDYGYQAVTTTATISSSGFVSASLGGSQPNAPFALVNILEELNSPGEWWLDRTTGDLYIYPPASMNGATIMMSQISTPLMNIQGSRYITFEDIAFEDGRGMLVRVENADHIKFQSCKMRDAGDVAVFIRGSTNSGLNSCNITNTGMGGLVLIGGNRTTLTPGNNYIFNTNVETFGRLIKSEDPGVYVGGDGNIVMYNHIHDGPHQALFFVGNNHVMENNEIDNAVYLNFDAGAVYSGRDWGYYGNMLRYNYIHDIKAIQSTSAHAIYLDDAASGVTIFGNIISNIGRLTIFASGGLENVMENNIVTGGYSFHHATGRAAQGYAYSCNPTYPKNAQNWNLLLRMQIDWNAARANYYSDLPSGSCNIGAGDYWNLTVFPSAYQCVTINHQTPPWSTSFPYLALMPDSCAGMQQCIVYDDDPLWQKPEGSVFARNIGWNLTVERSYSLYSGAAEDIPSLYYAGIGQNSYTQGMLSTPVVADQANGDFTVNLARARALTSPAFQDIPFRQIGLQDMDCSAGETLACGSDVGECRRGSRACVDGKFSEICTGEIRPRMEICNGLDDDCDGLIDEYLNTYLTRLSQCPGISLSCATDEMR